MVANTTILIKSICNLTTCAQSVAEFDLAKINDEEAWKYMAIIIFVSILMIIGAPGNLLVLYIYRGRFKKKSTSNYFIEALAVFDLIACTIGMPTEIYDLRYPYMFYSEVGCKVLRFSETFTVIGSSILLLEVAIDRYWKVCRPHDKMTVVNIKIMCGIAALMGLLIGLPAIFYSGTKPARYGKIRIGSDCTVKDYKLASIFFIVLCGIFFLICLLLTVFYTLLYLEVRQRRQRKFSSRQISSEPEQNSMVEKGPDFSKRSLKRAESDVKDSKDPKSPKSPKSPSFPLMKARMFSMSEKVRSSISRTTLILFIVTLAFVISYFPSLLVMILKYALGKRVSKTSVHTKVVIKLFSKFFLINNACNPLIYSFLNPYFRKECMRVFNSISCGWSAFCCRCCRIEPGVTDSTYSQST